ncbi:hypothetical protein JYQ62_08405 [Nostoc sp. UHCC 0702]|nr:hypothetical protein JYQ62_08405 [Nostoc sp. UHCC 0702]
MYDSLNLEDFRHILYIIRDNDKQHDWLTHKEIRVYLHCLRELWTELNISDSYWLPSIKFHFHAMALRISHEKRAILAARLLDLLVRLEQPNKSKQFDKSTEEAKNNSTEPKEADTDDIPFESGELLPLNPS